MSRSTSGGRWLAVGALVACLPVLSSLAVAGSQRAQQPAAQPADAQAKPRPDASPRGAGGREGRGGPRRELTDQDLERIIATARDIDPAWGDGLEALRAKDPAALRQKLGAQARMLIGLSMIRERQPELYQARVENFRLQRQIRAAAERVQKARAEGDAAAEAAALDEVRATAPKEFELDIKARGHELVAMEKAVKEARKRILADIAEREARVAEVIAAVERGEAPRFGRGTDAGDGGWWRRGEGDGARPVPGEGAPAGSPPKP